MKMAKVLLSLIGAVATVLPAAGAATADVESARGVSVLGDAEIEIHNPYSVFGFSIHAWGNGHSGRGVVWMSHHNDEDIGWLVARVDCVRAVGPLGVVTAVVSDAQDFAGAAPGDPIALTVRDNGTRDRISYASGEQAKKCRKSEQPEFEITRGDFRVSH